MAGKCLFNSEWMQQPSYKEWLLCDTLDKYKAKCRLCNKSFKVANMGESALKSHMKGEKHMKLLKILQSTNTSVINNPKTVIDKYQLPESTLKENVTLQSYLIKTETLDAEILWALNTIKSHHSYKSNENIEKMFKKMFPDSAIAAEFSCGEKKTAYYTVFGIAPHFKNLLLKDLCNKDYVLLFDESLNHMQQKKQLDLHIRFWNQNTVKTKYLTSVFLGHATAEDVFQSIQNAILPLKISNILQLSMDGPNVNWKIHDMFQQEYKTQYEKQIICTGSCGLHVIHNAFKHGFESSNWEISTFLSTIYYFLKDTPARREDYYTEANQKFPLKFISHRWVENISVCERALEVLPYFETYMENVKKGKLKEPTCKSFGIIQKHLSDKLLYVRLNIFLSVAKLFQPFLLKYQTDKPMMPFLSEDIKKLIFSIMQRFIKADVLKNTTTISLINVNYEDACNQCAKEDIDVGFIAEKKLKDLYASKKVSDFELMKIRSEFREILKKMLSKLLIKSPIAYSTVRHLSCLNPNNMVKSKQRCVSKFKLLLGNLSSMNIINASECDEVIEEFKDFLNIVVVENSTKFQEFSQVNSRLDELFSEFMKCKYLKLWSLVEKLLLLSHGQATVERGFSINKKIEVENLKGDSYIAHRLICDHINNLGGDITAVVIDKEMRASVRSARQKYHQYLEQQKKKVVEERKSAKRCLEEAEEKEFKKRKEYLENNIHELLKSADDYAEQAEKKIICYL